MAGAGAEPGAGPQAPEAPGVAGVAPEDLRDWAGLPEHVLVKVAGKLVAQTEAGWAVQLKEWGGYWTEERIQEKMAKRKSDGNCLFVFARVCKEWRKVQLKVGGPLCTRVESAPAASQALAPTRQVHGDQASRRRELRRGEEMELWELHPPACRHLHPTRG